MFDDLIDWINDFIINGFSSPPRRAPRIQLGIEVLEDRVVPTTNDFYITSNADTALPFYSPKQ
jgi:hypothetical protein